MISRYALQILLYSSALTSAAFAQDASSVDEQGIAEIVVTGTKASAAQRAQDVPIAVSVVSGAAIDEQSVRDLTELGYRLPNIRLQPTGLNPGHASYSMRGIGGNTSTPSDEPVVVTVLDGMVLGTSVGAAFQTFDLEAVEVFRGPQGVLFGKNATGGVVNVRTRRPTGKSELSLRGIFGSYDRYGGAFAAETPFAGDAFAGRLAVIYDHQGGFFKDLSFPGGRVGGAAETLTIRPSLLIRPADNLDINIIGEHFEAKSDGGVFRTLSDETIATSVFGAAPCVGRNICRTEKSGSDQDSQHIIGEINLDLGDVLLTSITAYRELSLANKNVDADGTEAPIFLFRRLNFDQDQFSQEVRAAGSVLDDKLSFVAGLYYFNQNWLWTELREIQLNPASAVLSVGGKAHQKHTSSAIFGQLDYNILPSLSLVVGGRYTDEKKVMNVSSLLAGNCLTIAACDFDFTNLVFKSGKFSPKIGLEWQAAENALVYANFTRGFRAGGFNSRHASLVMPEPYDDEEVKAYEVGVKSELFDRLLRLNVSAFRNEFSGLQRSILEVTPAGPVTVVRNAASAVIQGVEAEASIAPLRGLRFDFSGSYTDAGYKAFNGVGLTPAQVRQLDLERAPEWTFAAGVNYEVQINNSAKMTATVNYSYTSDYAASTLNLLGFRVPSLNLVDANIAVDLSDHLRLSLYGKNLTDEIYGSITTVQMPLLLSETIAPPRTFGLQIDYRF